MAGSALVFTSIRLSPPGAIAQFGRVVWISLSVSAMRL
jgi:hypothetical protein